LTRRDCKLTADDVAVATSGRRTGPSCTFSGVTTDSREALPGDLFVALRGPNFDGHDHVTSALDAGALGALVESVPQELGERTAIRVPHTLAALGALGRFWRLEKDLPVLALTGSNGKTSTKELAAALLGTVARVLYTEGNLNNRIGVPMTLLGIGDQHDVAVIEMGMNKQGEIGDLTRICVPDVALLLNVGPAHIGELGSLEAIAEAKAEMFHHAPVESTLVVNADDFRVMQHAAPFGRSRLRTFGEAADADVRLIGREIGATGQRLEVALDGAVHEVELGLVGRHAALNALAALAAVTALPKRLHPQPEVWSSAWRSISPVAGRFSIRRLGDVWLVDDAYNANPGSLASSLDALEEARGKAGFGVVLGEMQELGEHAERAHREAGEAIARAGASFLATLGEGARSASHAAGEVGVASHHEDDDLDALWAFVEAQLEPGTWLLLKGSRRARLERLVERLESS